MEKEVKIINEYLAILKRYKHHMLAIIISGIIITEIVLNFLTPIYKSTAYILIEQDNMPENIVQSLVTNYAEQRIQIINKKIMSSKNLERIVNKFDLYKEERKTKSIPSIIKSMRDDIQMELIGGEAVLDQKSRRLFEPTIGFTISFESKSPKIAQQVANELVDLYLNENIKQRANIIKETTSFLEFETNKLRSEISDLEEKIAEFKEKNSSNLPDLFKVNLTRLENIERQINENDIKISALKEKESFLITQLEQLGPTSIVFSSHGKPIYGAKERLAILKEEYISLSSKYSKGHPDLVKMRNEISALEKEVSGYPNKNEYMIQLKDKQTELSLLKDRYSSEHPDVKYLEEAIENLKQEIENIPDIEHEDIQPNNPAYIQLKAQLVSVQTELNSIQLSGINLQEKLSYYKKLIAEAPQVEKKYQSLMRDYQNATLKYREIKAKQMEASMARSMEKNKTGKEFSLLEAPLLPERPFKPNKQAIIFLGSLVSIAIAFSYVMIKESLNPSIYTASRLASVIGAPPLVVIPYLKQKKLFFRNKKIIIFIISIILIIFLVLYFFESNGYFYTIGLD